MSQTRTPSNGLKILEGLYIKHPNHESIRNSLVHTYIRLGFHDKAIDLIKNFYGKKQDIQSLRFKAWMAHKQDDIEKERSIWSIILDRSYIAQVHHPIGTLLLRSKHSINLKPSDIPLISVVRNEMLRLPFFLDYYRKLGVTQFIFIDNNSNDGSFEFLIKQPDCHIFWTNDSFTQAGQGMIWINHIINNTDIIHLNQWLIVADADEFLVYPNCETYPLSHLIKYLNTTDAETVPSFMLDMYSKNLFDDENQPTNFINTHIYFYNNYRRFYQIESPYLAMSGGIRTHLFHTHNAFYVKTGIFKKTNFILYLLSSGHKTTPLRMSDISSAFKHYKFAMNIKSKAEIEIKRKQYTNGGLQYNRYMRVINQDKVYANDSFIPTKSIKYRDSQQLVSLGIIKSSDKWNSFIF